MRELKFLSDLNVSEAEEILRSYGFIKYKENLKKFDYYGVSKTGNTLIVHLNDNLSIEKEENIKKLLRFKFVTPISLTWQLFRKSYASCKNTREKVSLIAQYLGLERPKQREICEANINKRKLNYLERDFIEQVLESFGIPFGFILRDGKLLISFERRLPKEFKKRLPKMLNIWLKPKEKVELNFDFDFKNPALTKSFIKRLLRYFPKESIQVRYSAHKRLHFRIKDRLFDPKEAIEYREKIGEGKIRLQYDKRRLKAGLRPDFLYDIKYGIPAGKWMSLEDFLREKEWKI